MIAACPALPLLRAFPRNATGGAPMPLSRLASLSFALIAGLGIATVFAQDVVVDPKIASMSVDEKVAARQAAMKEDGKELKAIGRTLGPDSAKVAALVLQNMTNFPALFADGATNDKSEALPIIWTEYDKFSAIFTKGQDTARAMLAAAQKNDATAYGASLKTLAGVCKQCHDTYREDTD
jgi:cytochrome c556